MRRCPGRPRPLPSLAIREEYVLVKASVIDSLSEAAKRLSAALVSLAPVEEVPERILDELILVAVPAGRHLRLDSLR